MMCRSTSCAVAVIVLTLAVVSTVNAQVRCEIAPFVAYYRPIGTFWPTSVSAVTLPARPSDKAGPALGVQARVWWPDHFGVEVQVAEAWSSVPQSLTPAGPRGPTSVTVLTLAAQGLYEVASSERLQLWLGAGGGLVRHGGDSYASYGSPASLAGTLSVGSNILLWRRLSAELGTTTYLYFLEVTGSGNTLQRGFQVDPLFHAGLTWAWRSGDGA
jgi:hypothetical protein